MARPKSLAKMSLDTLIELRDSVTSAISEQAESLRAQLANLTGTDVGSGRRHGRRPGRPKGSKLKGRKIAPKYRDKSGNTWSGRGAEPRWMRDAIKGGAKRDDFLIGKPAAKTKAPRKSKAPKKRKAAKGRRAAKKTAASKPAAAQAE